MSEQQRVALVTGASRGIGTAIALQLANEGYRVFGTATSEAGLKQIASQDSVGDGTIVPLKLDLNSDEDQKHCLDEIQSVSGQFPDILVNNAGITCDNLMLRMKDEEWQSVIDTNLTAVFKLTKKCIKSMLKRRWGRVITIGSVVGATGNSGQVNYASAKAALSGFTKSLALEVSSRNITINLVAPGFIETDMTQKLSDQVKAELLEKIPMNRLGQPQDIAQAVTFLASERAQYITGETIHVNGGMYMA